MGRASPTRRAPAPPLDAEEEAWRRLQHQARVRSLTIARTDARDGPVRYLTTRRGTELRLHDTEPDLLLYLRATK